MKIKRRVTNASVVTGLKGKIVNLMWMSVRIMFAALEVVVRILLERTSVFVKKVSFFGDLGGRFRGEFKEESIFSYFFKKSISFSISIM